MALSRRIPVITNRVERFTLDSNVGRLTAARNVDCLTVASFEVPSKLHLSLKSRVPSHNPPKQETLPDSLRFGTSDYTLNERPGRPTTFPLPPVLAPPPPLSSRLPRHMSTSLD